VLMMLWISRQQIDEIVNAVFMSNRETETVAKELVICIFM
jgi:hypothetical protein